MSRVCETKLDTNGIASVYIQEYITFFLFWVVMARWFWRKLQLPCAGRWDGRIASRISGGSRE